jgi:hypothetical protein
MLLLQSLDMVSPGGRLWVDMTNWYFSVYDCPYESITNFIGRHKCNWQRSSDSAGYHWALNLGANPQACLATVWAASSALASARSLAPIVQSSLSRWASQLWLHCDFSGRVSVDQEGLALEVNHGYVDAKVAVEILISNGNERASLLKTMKERNIFLTNCPLPVLTFCLRRQCNLRPAAGQAWDGRTRELEQFCLTRIENKLLECSLSDTPHEGAKLRYAYGKNRTTNVDPRSQASRLEQNCFQHRAQRIQFHGDTCRGYALS